MFNVEREGILVKFHQGRFAFRDIFRYKEHSAEERGRTVTRWWPGTADNGKVVKETRKMAIDLWEMTPVDRGNRRKNKVYFTEKSNTEKADNSQSEGLPVGDESTLKYLDVCTLFDMGRGKRPGG